jgi:hypothetical protein
VTDVAAPTEPDITTEEGRLAVKLAKAEATAREHAAGDDPVLAASARAFLADLDRFPRLADELAEAEAAVQKLLDERTAIFVRLDRRVSQAVIGFAWDGRLETKSLVGYFLREAKRKGITG